MGVRSGARWFVLALLLQASCLGAKSELWEPPDVPVREVHPRDDTGAEDAGPDADGEADGAETADVPDVPEVSDVDPCYLPCDDGIACTEDRCEAPRGCVFTPVDAWCDDGVECTVDVCVSGRGCESTTDLEQCDDGFDCTEDGCDWATGRCTHRTDDAVCNDYAECTADRCDVDGGCVYVAVGACPEFEHCDVTCHGCALDPAPPGYFLAFTLRELFRINPVAGTNEVIRGMGYDFLDLAVTSDSRLWGSTDDELASIEPCALHGRILYRPVEGTFGALGAGADGWLYLISPAGHVRRVQPDTWIEETVTPWPFTSGSVADITAGPGGILYAAGRSGSDPFTLYVIDPATSTVTAIGPIGPWDVEALAFRDGVVYGMSAEGDLLRIDAATGVGEAIGTIPPGPFMTFVGAASPPP